MAKSILNPWTPKSRATEIAIKDFKPMPLEDFTLVRQMALKATQLRAVSFRDKTDLGIEFFKTVSGSDWLVFELDFPMQCNRLAERNADFLWARLNDRLSLSENVSTSGNIVLSALNVGQGWTVKRFGGLWFEKPEDAMMFKLSKAST